MIPQRQLRCTEGEGERAQWAMQRACSPMNKGVHERKRRDDYCELRVVRVRMLYLDIHATKIQHTANAPER